MSTDAVFVDGKGNYSETDLPGFLLSEAPLSTYINAKHIGENLLLTNHTNHIIIRTGHIYGKDTNQNIEARTKRLIHEIKKYGYANTPANTFKTFVHIDDLSKAIIEIINMNLTGVLHVAFNTERKLLFFLCQKIIATWICNYQSSALFH